MEKKKTFWILRAVQGLKKNIFIEEIRLALPLSQRIGFQLFLIAFPLKMKHFMTLKIKYFKIILTKLYFRQF